MARCVSVYLSADFIQIFSFFYDGHTDNEVSQYEFRFWYGTLKAIKPFIFQFIVSFWIKYREICAPYLAYSVNNIEKITCGKFG